MKNRVMVIKNCTSHSGDPSTYMYLDSSCYLSWFWMLCSIQNYGGWIDGQTNMTDKQIDRQMRQMKDKVELSYLMS